MHQKDKTPKHIIIVIILGILTVVLAWFEEDIIGAVSSLKWDIAYWKYSVDDEVDRAYEIAESICMFLVNLFHILLFCIFICMIVVSVAFLVKKYKVSLFKSFIPILITLVFFAAQIFVPFINYPSPNTDGSYFSENIFDEFTIEWYSKQLKALNEPSLYSYEIKENVTVYRFLYLRTFQQPISIRVQLNHSTKSGNIYYKICDGAGGFNPGDLILDETISLSSKQYKEIINLFFICKFWHIKTFINYNGFDGETWIIEGVEKNRYHIVERWCPEYDNTSKIGSYLLELCGW